MDDATITLLVASGGLNVMLITALAFTVKRLGKATVATLTTQRPKHEHAWRLVSKVGLFSGGWFGDGPITQVNLKCVGCGALDSQMIQGRWSIAALMDTWPPYSPREVVGVDGRVD